MAKMQAVAGPGVSLQAALSEQPELLKDLKAYDPLRLAATFAGLLTVPDLQSNCIRLETLVHVAIVAGEGHRKPNAKIISRLFSKLGEGTAGWKEDPAEDVYVSSIATPHGNFRVLEGVWEGAGFYLQRVIDTLEAFPTAPRFDRLRACVYALLRLSDLVCERAGLKRHQLGNATPLAALPTKFCEAGSALRRIVKFSEVDLAANGIEIERIGDFIFDPETRGELVNQLVGHSSLERFPIGHRNGDYYLLLPTAVSVAIRRYVIENMQPDELREAFVGLLADEYARLFSDTPLLGSSIGGRVEFRKTDNGLFAGVSTAMDRGLFMNIVFFVDPLQKFEDTGFLDIYNLNPAFLQDLHQWVDFAYEDVRKRAGFRGGLSLIVGCGIGRGAIGQFHEDKWPGWRTEFISASDFVTLSWTPDFKPLSLWRLCEAQDRLSALGVQLANINGLLNIVAWTRSLDGHLVPHGNLPDNFGSDDTPNLVLVEQNALRSLRHEVAINWDPHTVQDRKGRWLIVRKDGQALFVEDNRHPFFIAEDKGDGRWPLCVYETANRPWWCRLETTETTQGAVAYQLSKMLKTWLCRAALVLEEGLPSLPSGPVEWRCRFEGNMGESRPHDNQEFLTFEEALASITITIDRQTKLVTLTMDSRFADALFHPENIAEHALVVRTVEGFAQLAGMELPPSDRDALVTKIVPDSNARQSHRFMTREFRDYMRHSVPATPITVNPDDAAFIKLGLGWRIRDRSLGGDIRGRKECTTFLNAVAELLADEVCQELKSFDRRSVIEFALRNHESAAMDRDNWQYTAAAVLSVHDDKEATLQTMAQHDYELNAVFQASRLFVEFAICECPLTEGKKPGRLDISRLMAKLLMIAGMGGWSDAIYWDAMEARVRVTPLGDIHANVSFSESILAPYGRAGSDLRVDEAVSDYAKHLEEVKPRPTDLSQLPSEFWAAWEEQFGASFDLTRKFVDFVEELGQGEDKAVFQTKKSRLLNAKLEGERLPAAPIASLLEFLTFKSRPQWKEVPVGYEKNDVFPWRFRRQLTILRRPFVQLDNGDDPTVLVAPGILRDGLAYMFGNYHRGDFPRWQLKPKMNRWAGVSRDAIGREFSRSVAKRFKELGWEADSEIEVTKLLRKGFGRNYGDVDVIAWNRGTGRVLIIECKDVQYRKTYGEIAEQLADFRGELRNNGKPDDLLKHLDRVDLISAHTTELAKYLGFKPTSIESHLVFKNPVPMQFALKRMEGRVAVHVFAQLDKM